MIITGFTLLAGPIGIITALLVGLGIVIYNVIEIFKILSNDLNLVWAGIKIMFKEAIDYIIGLFSPLFDVIDRVKSALSSIADGVKGAVSKVTSKLKGKARGGGVQVGQSYLVGERGPELFTPSGNGSIIPNNKLAMAGGGNVIVNINGGTYLDPSVAERIGDMIINRFRMSNRI